MAGSADLTPLMVACLENDGNKVEEILNKDQHAASGQDPSGKVAMHHCAERGQLDIFQKIFDADPSVMDKRDEDGYTPLTFAVIGGNEAVVDFLFEKGVDMNNVDAERHSHIHWATVCGHTAILGKLLKKGALASTPDLYGAHALHYATQTATLDTKETSASANTLEAIEMLRILLKYGANVNCTDFEERTPLLWAASCGNSSAVSALLEAGADKHACDKDLLTALHCAASRGHSDVIRTICKMASDVQIDARDRNGSSALFYAAALGHVDAVKALLELGARADMQDKKLRTAAHCAAAKGQLGTVKVLHQHGTSFALENYRGDLPIHEAVQAGSLELIDWMLSISPTYTNATNHDGRTALHLAAALGHLDTCKMLVEKGANKDALMLSKASCVTALDLAEQKGHPDVVEYLRSIGAQKCTELSPTSIVDEFKKEMATRKLASSKGSRKNKSTCETHSQTDETPKTDQAVDTGRDCSERADVSETEEEEAEQESGEKEDDKTRKKVKRSKKEMKGEKWMDSSSEGVLVKTVEKEEKEEGSREEVSESKQDGLADGQALSKTAEAEGTDKKKKHGKRKTKTKGSSKTSNIEKTKKMENGDLDSSRTSADVSEIGTATEAADGEEKGKKKWKDGSKREKENEREYSEEEEDRKDGSEILSETGNITKTGPIKSIRLVHGSGLNLSLGGSDSDRQSSRGYVLSTRSQGAIDQFRVNWESSLRSSVQRYAEEKRIFQELANLKRLQIQYGNVQEEVIVRRLIDDFLRGYNVKPGDFQVNTFNLWEKFLYDQLKILYRKEKESLLRSYESKLKNQASLFEQKHAAATGRRKGIEDHVDRLSRTYGIAPIPMQYSPRLYKASFMSSNVR